jgi:hypothetical protein
MKVRDLLRVLAEDGWHVVVIRGSQNDRAEYLVVIEPIAGPDLARVDRGRGLETCRDEPVELAHPTTALDFCRPALSFVPFVPFVSFV